MIKEFKEFALKGNVLDLAVGLIIGGAFGKIVTSLVNDIVMPPFGLLSVFYAGSVDGNDLTEVKVYDKDEKPNTIQLTDHTGVRITKKDSSRVTFYFNTLQIKDSTITGSQTHFFEWHFKPIKLADVVRIEIQK